MPMPLVSYCLLATAAAALLGFPPADGQRLVDLTSEWEVLPGRALGGFRNPYNPKVIRVPDRAYPYRMWLFGWAAEDDNPGVPGADAIFHARSRDLRSWEVYAGDDTWDTTGDPRTWVPVLWAADKPWDNVHNGDPSVVYRDGAYFMALSSVGFDTVTDADGHAHTYVVSCIMGATSADGIRWTKSPRPILMWSEEFRNRWEIISGKIGDPPPDYYGSYHRPSLLYDDGRWRLWFDYFVPGTFVSMGYAENDGDFLHPDDWHVVRAGDKPLIRDWPNPSVVHVGGRYVAFSDAPGYPAEWGGDGRQTTAAESADGLNWSVLGHIRPWGRESSHVPEAFVDDTAADGPWLYLFLSWKPDVQPWDYRYKEIRVLRRHIGPAEERRP